MFRRLSLFSVSGKENMEPVPLVTSKPEPAIPTQGEVKLIVIDYIKYVLCFYLSRVSLRNTLLLTNMMK